MPGDIKTISGGTVRLDFPLKDALLSPDEFWNLYLRPLHSAASLEGSLVPKEINMAAERRELWKAVAIAAAQRWVMPDQPVIVADEVLEAFDIRFCGKVAPEPVKASSGQSSGDPVDAILGTYGIKA